MTAVMIWLIKIINIGAILKLGHSYFFRKIQSRIKKTVKSKISEIGYKGIDLDFSLSLLDPIVPWQLYFLHALNWFDLLDNQLYDAYQIIAYRNFIELGNSNLFSYVLADPISKEIDYLDSVLLHIDHLYGSAEVYSSDVYEKGLPFDYNHCGTSFNIADAIIWLSNKHQWVYIKKYLIDEDGEIRKYNTHSQLWPTYKLNPETLVKRGSFDDLYGPFSTIRDIPGKETHTGYTITVDFKYSAFDKIKYRIREWYESIGNFLLRKIRRSCIKTLCKS